MVRGIPVLQCTTVFMDMAPWLNNLDELGFQWCSQFIQVISQYMTSNHWYDSHFIDLF